MKQWNLNNDKRIKTKHKNYNYNSVVNSAHSLSYDLLP